VIRIGERDKTIDIRGLETINRRLKEKRRKEKKRKEISETFFETILPFRLTQLDRTTSNILSLHFFDCTDVILWITEANEAVSL